MVQCWQKRFGDEIAYFVVILLVHKSWGIGLSKVYASRFTSPSLDIAQNASQRNVIHHMWYDFSSVHQGSLLHSVMLLAKRGPEFWDGIISNCTQCACLTRQTLANKLLVLALLGYCRLHVLEYWGSFIQALTLVLHAEPLISAFASSLKLHPCSL